VEVEVGGGGGGWVEVENCSFLSDSSAVIPTTLALKGHSAHAKGKDGEDELHGNDLDFDSMKGESE